MIPPVRHILDFAGLLNAPFGKRAVQTGSDVLSNRDRHNPLRSIPSTDDVIALGLELSGFSYPQTLTHTRPIESLLGGSITGLQTLPKDERNLTSVKFS